MFLLKLPDDKRESRTNSSIILSEVAPFLFLLSKMSGDQPFCLHSYSYWLRVIRAQGGWSAKKILNQTIALLVPSIGFLVCPKKVVKIFDPRGRFGSIFPFANWNCIYRDFERSYLGFL